MNKRHHWPDFETSMRKSRNYIDNPVHVDEWNLLKDRYNYIKYKASNEAKIPKIIHQIWLGGPLPEKQRVYCDAIKKALPKNWEYKLWLDNDIKDIPFFHNLEAFNSTPNYGQKSDLLRLEILYHIGGVYLDTDVVITKSFDELLDLDFFCSIAFDNWPSLLNSIMGSSPYNSTIKDMLTLDKDVKWNDGMAVIDTTGPYHITRKVFTNLKNETNIIALPVSFLCPLPNFDAHNDHAQYIAPESFCCHLWHESWNH
jgi:mannosyltransferase OCH1-like enzyme